MDNILTPEILRLVASADISTPEKLAKFKVWQNVDGTIEGLRSLTSAGEASLLPCPFCGARPVFIYRDDSGDGYSSREQRADAWDLQCNTPNCYLEHGADMWTTQEDATVMWNKRP